MGVCHTMYYITQIINVGNLNLHNVISYIWNAH